MYYYDESGHLLRVTNPIGDTTTYTYDGDGKRVRLESRSGSTMFIYDGNEVLAEMDATGVLQAAYTRMPSGRLVSEWQKGETYWYHQDGLGSTMALTDETGKVRNKYGYDEYGNVVAGTTEEVFNRFTFTGQAWDASTGLYFYKARYYNPQIGRFLTQDTYGGSSWAPWTQNLYSYVGNNPVNMIDPTGHAAQPTDEGSGSTVSLRTLAGMYGGAVGWDPDTRQAAVILNGRSHTWNLDDCVAGSGCSVSNDHIMLNQAGFEQMFAVGAYAPSGSSSSSVSAASVALPIGAAAASDSAAAAGAAAVAGLAAVAVAVAGDSSPPFPVYHYTDEKGIVGIAACQCINPSLREGGDAFYGSGVYSTTAPPGSGTRAGLAASLWGDPRKASKAAYFVALNLNGLWYKMAPNGTTVVIQTSGPLDIRGHVLGAGPNPAP